LSHKNLSKLIIVLTILTITSSFLLLTSGSTSFHQNSSSLTKTENLFSLLEESNSTVLEIVHQLEEDGVEIPKESYDEYDQAQIFAAESQILFQSGNYSEAENKIIQSLASFKEVLILAYTSVNNQTIQDVTHAENFTLIQSSINRYYKLLAQIQNLTSLATQDGFDTIDLQEKIKTMTTLLANASNNVEQNQFEKAQENITKASELGNYLTDELKNVATVLKISRLESYIENTTKRLVLIREETISLSTKYPISKIDDIFAALDDAESSLSTAKSSLENYQIDNALTELSQSKIDEEKAISFLQSDTILKVPSKKDKSVQKGSP